MLYHYQDAPTSHPPPIPYCSPPPFTSLMNNLDQQMDNGTMTMMDHQQQFMLYQEESRGRYDSPAVNVMTIQQQQGYWPTEQQQPPPSQPHVSPPLQNKLNTFLPSNYCLPPHPMHPSSLANGEMGSVFFFSPPFSYHPPHQMTN